MGSAMFIKMVCFSTKVHEKNRVRTFIKYMSYRIFEEKVVTDLSLTPFHIAEIFDDVNDNYWFCNEMIKGIVDEGTPQ